MLDVVQVDDDERPSDDAVNDEPPVTATPLLPLELSTIPQPVAASLVPLLIFSVSPDVPSRHTQVLLNVPPPAVAVADTVSVASLEENTFIKNVETGFDTVTAT
jgi:hypothetical protein